MAAGPRDTPHGRDTAADLDGSQESRQPQQPRGLPHPDLPADERDDTGGPDDLEPLDPHEPREHPDSLGGRDGLNGPAAGVLGDSDDLLGATGEVVEAVGMGLDIGGEGGDGDPLDAGGMMPAIGDGASFRELRPPRRLRIWQLAPITALAVGGSLMFAFPLAFESGDAGPVVAMLGLLLCLCAAGWGLMAARRVGQTWPGLPSRGSGERPDWRYVAGYTVLIALLAVLAVWRVARLR